jgi:hypothetical protein
MRSDSPLTLDQIRKAAPAVFQDNPHPDRSGQYVHISTEEVLQAMQDAGYGVARAQQTNARAAEAMGYARHLLAFRPLEAFGKTTVGDAIPEVILVNAHNGLCSYQLTVGLFRLVCANGMVAGRSFEHVQIPHRGDAAMRVVDGTQHIFEHYVPRLQEWQHKASTTTMGPRQQSKFAEQAQLIRFPDKPFDHRDLLKARRGADEGDSVWHVYNRVQENLMKGGINTVSATGRNLLTKPIHRVTKDVIYNRQLWDLASSYIKEAA